MDPACCQEGWRNHSEYACIGSRISAYHWSPRVYDRCCEAHPWAWFKRHCRRKSHYCANNFWNWCESSRSPVPVTILSVVGRQEGGLSERSDLGWELFIFGMHIFTQFATQLIIPRSSITSVLLRSTILTMIPKPLASILTAFCPHSNPRLPAPYSLSMLVLTIRLVLIPLGINGMRLLKSC